MSKGIKIAALALACSLAFGLCACAGGGNDEDKGPSGTTNQPNGNPKPGPNENGNPDPNGKEEDVFEVVYRDYAPASFSKDAKSEASELGEGVHLVRNEIVKTNGQVCVVYAVEVDLTLASVAAGTKGDLVEGYAAEKAAPYAQALAWEERTGGRVYASVNADFFGGPTVNAFVKNGVILKDSHNDKGLYDYANEESDVPASAPMLFGLKGDSAQIGPIRSYTGDPSSAAVKETLVKSKLFYALFDGTNRLPVEQTGSASLNGEKISFLAQGKMTALRGVAVKVDLSGGFSALKVLERKELTGRTTLSASENAGWLQVGATTGAAAEYLSSLDEGDEAALSVASEDGAWNGYETILGCRHALVIDDKIPATVAKEFSNGTKNAEVPRTAIGLKDEHTAVVFCVESLHYGGRAAEGDPHGLSLAELAEFVYFYGCKQAANFDGGGSSQLVVRGEEETEGKVLVRSSDTGSSEVLNTRSVVNSLLVTDKRP